MNTAIVTLSFIGLFLSIHALWINHQYRRRMRYSPWCDFSESVSCSRAFTSKYSRSLGIHTGWFGVIAYPLVAWLAFSGQSIALVAFGSLLVLASLSLAYISFVKMHNACIVCIAVYGLNFAVLALAVTAY